VQTTRERVSPFAGGFIELAPGVQTGQHHHDRGLFFLRMQVYRDASSIIADPDRAIHAQSDTDLGGMPR